METTKKEKQFDAVKMMRDIRDKLNIKFVKGGAIE